jgi:ABC-type nitrate/sulfonate/bicarbonate transport system substrate-binding protein
VPEFEEFPYTVLSVSPEVADQKPDVVRRVVHAIGQSNDMFTKDLGKAIDIMKASFSSVPPAAIERAVMRDKSIYPAGGRMTEAMWRNALKVAASMKMTSRELPYAEGTLWTNKFTA